jgi:NAD(P)H-flavin reductase
VSVDVGDIGWKGNVGVVTTLLPKVKLNLDKMAAVVCGPPVMMKFATLELIQMGLAKDRLYLSMEKNMSCGLGKCGHCRLGPYYVCQDGPVFTYDKIETLAGLWE